MRRYRRVILDLELGAEPIAGRVELPGRAAEPFNGWLQLAAALERAGREPDPAVAAHAGGLARPARPA